jgi:hypothetical protein
MEGQQPSPELSAKREEWTRAKEEMEKPEYGIAYSLIEYDENHFK